MILMLIMIKSIGLFVLCSIIVNGCLPMTTTKTIEKTAIAGKTEIATFAGGCFWCMEAAFQEVPGVLTAISGYTGGNAENPTYDRVLSGKTGHQEAVQLTYDPQKISYGQLLDLFWQQI